MTGLHRSMAVQSRYASCIDHAGPYLRRSHRGRDPRFDGQAPSPAGPGARCAAVHGGHDERPRGEPCMRSCPRNGHAAVLQRFAQRVQQRARVIRQLVHEQHTAVRQRQLAGPRRVTAAHEPVARHRMVRRTKWPRAHEPAPRCTQAGGGVQPGHQQRLDVFQCGKKPGQPARQHALAATGRAHQQHVMSASGSDLQRVPRHRT